MKGFQAFGLKEEIVKGIDDLYYEEPTPIQQETIPLALEGKDLIGQAQTGTGKTAAFVIPMLQKIQSNSKDIQGLILTPTRELAIQITEEITRLAKHMDVRVLCLHGGRNIQSQIQKLDEAVHIVVGTPGRLLDHLRRETLHFGRIKLLVLDEADKLLEMGFQEDVELIISNTGNKRQILLFSATMPDEVRQLAHRFMFQPPHIRIDANRVTSSLIGHYFMVVNQSDKLATILDLDQQLRPFLAIVFANTQKRVEQITEHLQTTGLSVKALHGGLSQNKREQLMQAFREMKFQYLVCTDVVARGLDVEGVTHVINFDIPSDTESYIHRVGRTGRAGQQGMAITLVSPRQRGKLTRFEKAIKEKIDMYWPAKGSTAGATAKGRKKDTKEAKNEQQAKQGKEDKTDKAAQHNKDNKPKRKPTVKPGYKKKLALAKQKEMQKGKRKRITQLMEANRNKRKR